MRQLIIKKHKHFSNLCILFIDTLDLTQHTQSRQLSKKKGNGYTKNLLPFAAY